MPAVSRQADFLPPRHEQTQPSSVLWAAGGLGTIAAIAVAVLPALVGIWRDFFALPVEQSGYLAAAEIYAQVAGTVLFIAVRNHATWRTLAVVGLVVLAGANTASALSSSFSALFTARCIAGVGAGLLRAQCLTAFASAARPGLVFALYASAQVISAALVTVALPAIIGFGGPRFPFLLLAATALLALSVCRCLPTTNSRVNAIIKTQHQMSFAAIMSLVALFAYFLGQGGLWTYLDPIGTSRSISAEGITSTLSALNFAGLAGTLGIGALAHRVPPRLALIVLACLTLGSVCMLYSAHTTAMFMAAACGFYFSWCASFPFQFALIAAADRTKTASAILPAIDALGLATGGAVAALLLPIAGIDAAAWVCIGGTLAGVVGFLLSRRAPSAESILVESRG